MYPHRRAAAAHLALAALAALVACALAAAPVLARDPPRHHAAHATARRTAPPAATFTPIPAPDPSPFSSAPPPPEANGPLMVEGPDGKRHACVEQRAQDFLIRSNWFNHGPEGSQSFQRSLRFRTEHYGYFPGFGRPEWNHTAPRENAVAAHFLGMPIQINARVVPALACVEAALLAGPAHLDYHPHGIGGIRFHNTYYGGEVSNHVYGIAMDIDSDTNTCCGCVGAWSKHPACGRRVASIYERMSMPRSWVDVFERYGWYWLGHDVLQDTMHFEFLGDPDKILAP
jgi:hypothetical protein